MEFCIRDTELVMTSVSHTTSKCWEVNGDLGIMGFKQNKSRMGLCQKPCPGLAVTSGLGREEGNTEEGRERSEEGDRGHRQGRDFKETSRATRKVNRARHKGFVTCKHTQGHTSPHLKSAHKYMHTCICEHTADPLTLCVCVSPHTEACAHVQRGHQEGPCMHK